MIGNVGLVELDQRLAGGAARLVLRCARVAGPVGARGALDDLFRDHHLLDAFQALEVEHGVKQDTFHDRA